jgi:quinol monooxygenase YgiN
MVSMSISFLIAAAGTLAALVATALLIRRCAQSARVDLVAWILALAGMAIGLAAQAAGYHGGFGPTTFRAAQLGLGLIAPLSLAWGMAEISARGLVMRFAARLCLCALFVVAAVILATDVLSDQPFGRDWPLARAHYQFLPLGLLAVVAAVILVTILVTLAVTALRSRHEPGWRPVLLVLGAAAVAALATQGLLVNLPVNSAYAGLSVVAVVTGWLAGDRAARVRLAALRGAGHGADHGAGHGAAPAGRGVAGPYYARTGSGPGYTGDDSMDLYRDGYRYGDSGAYQAYQGDQGDQDDRYGYDSAAFAAPGFDSQEFPAPGDSRGFAAPDDSRGFAAPGDSRGFAAQGIDPDAEPVTGSFDALYRDSAAPSRARDAALPAAAGESLPGEPETGMQLAALSAAALGAAALADPAADTERLYGQIAIYTLLESGAAEFDRLASTVLEQVRTTEPDTLVFVVHGVPSAPLQRILYQVYRDRAAYDEHQRKSYVTDFDSRLRPLVLATNVIELGVREAKVSSLGPAPRAGRLP